jgi:hypothetical protein
MEPCFTPQDSIVQRKAVAGSGRMAVTAAVESLCVQCLIMSFCWGSFPSDLQTACYKLSLQSFSLLPKLPDKATGHCFVRHASWDNTNDRLGKWCSTTKTVCSELSPILIDRNTTLKWVLTAEQKTIAACSVVKVNQFRRHWCSKLLDTYPVTS